MAQFLLRLDSWRIWVRLVVTCCCCLFVEACVWSHACLAIDSPFHSDFRSFVQYLEWHNSYRGWTLDLFGWVLLSLVAVANLSRHVRVLIIVFCFDSPPHRVFISWHQYLDGYNSYWDWPHDQFGWVLLALPAVSYLSRLVRVLMCVLHFDSQFHRYIIARGQCLGWHNSYRDKSHDQFKWVLLMLPTVSYLSRHVHLLMLVLHFDSQFHRYIIARRQCLGWHNSYRDKSHDQFKWVLLMLPTVSYLSRHVHLLMLVLHFDSPFHSIFISQL